MKQNSGFTLIELVVVIVLLGILAAVAVPKMVDMSGDARQAAVQGAAGALASASATNYATYVAKSAATANYSAGNPPYAVGTATACTTSVANNLVSGITFVASPSANNEFSIALKTAGSTCSAGNPIVCTITSSQGSKTADANMICTG